MDPPYNTGEDGFQYNDKFSRSAWLTFMKNRIQVAKELLSDDGVLLIQISFHEYPYLRTLLDSPEILGEENHIFDMNVLVRHPERALTADKLFNDVVEYTLIYQKSASFVMPKIEVLKTSDKYKYDVEVAGPPHEVRIMGNKTVEIYLPEQVNVVKKAGHIEGLHRETIRGSIREKNSSGRFYVANLEDLRDEFPPLTFFKVEGMGDDSLGYRWFELPKENIKNGAYYQGMPQSSNVTLKPYPNFIDFVKEYNSANHEGVYSFRNGKKPEAFIKYYLDMFTEENDLVMDFFMGSATTQAVAMKMHRRFIGIEQMDYIKTVSVPRLEKVIEGEQSGISKGVNWHGGGSFLYAELMPKNMTYLQKIIHTKELLELKSIWEHMINGINGSSKVDINFRADLDKLNWNEGFDENKRLLVKILDKNGLYYNYSEIDDETVRESISDEDYQFNKVFYERRE
ncbi:DNA methyltransferase [Listeria monocytogenes]|uniref:DNA methyltransferase n=1 Tax=Listeria monocytogenes TaxID=1639 RepID=UPI001F1EB4ED|nr:site-specific DNA-methyltransferase [Listeria monocytogenes]